MAGINFGSIQNAITGMGKGITKFAKSPAAQKTAKVAGAVALATVIYDAHVCGKEKAASKEMINGANRFWNDAGHYMTSDTNSATLCKLKQLRFNSKQYSIYRAKDKVVGYGQGALESAGEKLPIIGLSVLALKFKTPGKVAGAILAALGVKSIVCDVLRIGKPEDKIC